ncbi:MAG TPA: DUF1289 domain-containing protein [Sphingobium sp.]
MTLRSPCIGACRIDSATGWFIGCARTLAEIAEWGGASDDRRRGVLAKLPERLVTMASTQDFAATQKTSLAIKSQ